MWEICKRNHSCGGVQWMRLLRGPKTDSDHVMNDTIGTTTVRRPLKRQGLERKSGAAGNRTQGLWLEPPVLCHWATTPDGNHPPVLPLLALLEVIVERYRVIAVCISWCEKFVSVITGLRTVAARLCCSLTWTLSFFGPRRSLVHRIPPQLWLRLQISLINLCTQQWLCISQGKILMRALLQTQWYARHRSVKLCSIFAYVTL